MRQSLEGVKRPECDRHTFVVGYTADGSQHLEESLVRAGLVPALRFSVIDLSAAIRTQNAGHGRARRGWSGDVAVAAQVAIATIVLIAAGLLLRTSRNLHRVDTGFDPNNVLMAAIDLDYTTRESGTIGRSDPGVRG